MKRVFKALFPFEDKPAWNASKLWPPTELTAVLATFYISSCVCEATELTAGCPT